MYNVFVGGLKYFEPNKTGDYHQDMDGYKFDENADNYCFRRRF